MPKPGVRRRGNPGAGTPCPSWAKPYLICETAPRSRVLRGAGSLDILDVRERLEKEIILALQDQGQVILWLKRTTRYLPEVEAVLRESGLPPDLKYVPWSRAPCGPMPVLERMP